MVVTETGKLRDRFPYVRVGSGPRTLVFGGTADPYFPESILRRTPDGVPNSELDLVRAGKHAAFHEWKWRFDGRATAFLDRRARAVG